MKIDSASVTRRLDEIRRQVGAPPVEFIPPPPAGRIDEDLLTVEAVQSLFHPSGILMRQGRPVFAYIRDHISSQYGYSDNPEERNKVHFTFCQTLKRMAEGGRFQRYRLTNRDDNRYLVDIRDSSGRTQERDGEILFPCRDCLDNVSYRCYDKYLLPEHEKKKTVREFDAKEAFRLLWQHFDMFRPLARGLKSATQPTGYAANFHAISRAFRRSRNFTCEQCGVQLSGAHQGLVDTHHISGDKSNNRYDNLRCLCKLCHAEQHSHYRVSPQARRIITLARRYQKISY